MKIYRQAIAAPATARIFSNISCLNAPLLPLLSEAGRIEGRNRQHTRIARQAGRRQEKGKSYGFEFRAYSDLGSRARAAVRARQDLRSDGRSRQGMKSFKKTCRTTRRPPHRRGRWSWSRADRRPSRAERSRRKSTRSASRTGVTVARPWQAVDGSAEGSAAFRVQRCLNIVVVPQGLALLREVTYRSLRARVQHPGSPARWNISSSNSSTGSRWARSTA